MFSFKTLFVNKTTAPENPVNYQLNTTDFSWLMAGLCQLHHIPFDADLLIRQNPPPHSPAQILKVLADLGMRAQSARLDDRSRQQITLPFIAFEKRATLFDSTAANEAHPALVTLVLMAKGGGERVLYFPAGCEQAQNVPVSNFLAHYEADVITVERIIPEPAEQGADLKPAFKHQPFGFQWFIPELLKHKSVWRDVLLASLAIQLLGLGLPLFTQVVIDKVVVHQTLSTLQVVGAGMGWIRQQLILHTGNQVDAILGMSVFRHLRRFNAIFQ